MNPYPQRLEELHAYLEGRYGVKDREATEILLACLIRPAETQTYRHPWIIVETDYPNRETEDAWFALGISETFPVRSLALARVLRTQKCEALVQEWLSERREGRPAVFVDSEWRRLAGSSKSHVHMTDTKSYGALLSQCLRLKAEHPKSDRALRSLEERAADRMELRRLASRVIECSHRQLAQSVFARISVPRSYLYWLELVQKLCPVQGDWDVLAGGIHQITVNRMYLRQEGPPNWSEDWKTAERLMRDTIPYMTRWIMERAALPRAAAAAGMDAYRKTGENLSASFLNEVRRLVSEGVLVMRKSVKTYGFKYHPWLYRLANGDWNDLLDYTKRILVL